MNELARAPEKALAIGAEPEELIEAGMSENTLKAYQRVLLGLNVWLDTELDDVKLAAYIT